MCAVGLSRPVNNSTICDPKPENETEGKLMVWLGDLVTIHYPHEDNL